MKEKQHKNTSVTLRLAISVIYSEWDEALDGVGASLRTRNEAALFVSEWVKRTIKEKVPEGKACSLVLGVKTE